MGIAMNWSPDSFTQSGRIEKLINDPISDNSDRHVIGKLHVKTLTHELRSLD
jgi:hypothetical protein